VALEVKAKPGHHRIGWCWDHRGRARHGGGGGSSRFGGGGQVACGEDGLGQRRKVKKDGLGRRCGRCGEDGLGAAARGIW
jgi:hypothetical protein